MENKRGQFYLLAAIVIIAIILTFVGISNYSEIQMNSKIYDLGEELGIEANNVIDHGIIQQGEVSTYLEEFVEEYAQYAQSDSREIYFIFGSEKGITLVTYEDQSTGSINIGGTTLTTTEGATRIQEISADGDEIIRVKIREVEYEFPLKKGENFYYIILEDIGEETLIAKN